MRAYKHIILTITIMFYTFFFAFGSNLSDYEIPETYQENEVIYTVDSYEEAALLAETYQLDLIEYQTKLARFKTLPGSDFEELMNAGFSYNSSLTVIGKPVPLTDPYLKNQYGITLTNIDDVWKIQEGSSNVVVAIIDTGIDTDHPEFINRISALSYNTATNTLGIAAVEDDEGHGTMVAGVIGAIRNNSIGIAGITNNTQLMIIKANNEGLDTFVESNIIEGIYYAVDHGADIINLSLGSSYANPQTKTAVEYATSHGVFVVGSAGNEGNDTPMYPASFNDVISVGAVDSGSLIAPYSNYNEYVDIVGPGTAIYTTSLNNTYASASGTSFSGPYITGIIALYLSSYPDSSIASVKTTLYSSAKDLGLEGYDVYYGYGLVDALSLFSSTYHEVSFVLPEGAELDSVFVEDGMLLTIGEVPVLQYYEFVGWYLDENFTALFDPFQPVTSNLTLYARYDLTQIRITWMVDGTVVLENYYLPGETVVFPVLSLEHQTFSGWYTDTSYTQNAQINLAEETIIYYGYYEPIYYTYHFYDSDRVTIIDTIEVAYDEQLIYPLPPEKASDEIFDYEFTEWELPLLYQTNINSIYPKYKSIFKTSLISLNKSIDTVYVNDIYQDKGVSSESTLLKIETVNQINTAKAGKYPLYYAVYYQDEIIYYLVRYITVLPKEVNIILTMRKGISTLYVGDTYKEEGAYANYGTVTVSGNVDTSVAGVYIITYQAKYLEQIKTLKRYVYVIEKPVIEKVHVLYYYKEEEYLYEA